MQLKPNGQRHAHVDGLAALHARLETHLPDGADRFFIEQAMYAARHARIFHFAFRIDHKLDEDRAFDARSAGKVRIVDFLLERGHAADQYGVVLNDDKNLVLFVLFVRFLRRPAVREVFGLEVPEGLHGNEAFDNDLLGAELHAEHFFGGGPEGFFAGPEVGVSRFEVTHRKTGASERRVQVSTGVRGGYRLYVGLGDLYLSPQGGLVATLNGDDFEIAGDTFETGPITPFVTIGFGWSF